MRKEQRTVYFCSHCKKHMLGASAMARHEKFCGNNPINMRDCYICKHLKETTTSYIHHRGYGLKAKAFQCELLGHKLYPVAAERRNLPVRFPDTFKNQIPFILSCPSLSINHGSQDQ